MKGASSSLHSDIKMKVKSSIFDVVSPISKGAGGSKSAEMEAKDDAVASLLAWVDDVRREKLMGGCESHQAPLVATLWCQCHTGGGIYGSKEGSGWSVGQS
jgi:hypothetical protein